MNYKYISVIFMAFMCFGLIFGCGKAEPDEVAGETVGDRALVAYYKLSDGSNGEESSLEEDIENEAVKLGMESGAELFSMETIEEYPDDPDERYELALEEIEEEMSAELDSEVEDFESFGSVTVVCAAWGESHIPPAVRAFFEGADFSGRTIYLDLIEGDEQSCVLEVEDICPEAEVKIY